MLQPVSAVSPATSGDRAHTPPNAEESPIDRFEEIFRLLQKALKCIREFHLRTVKGLGVEALQRSHEELGADIRQLQRIDRVDHDRWAGVFERVGNLTKAPFEAVSKIEGYVKLCSIYRSLQVLYWQEIAAPRGNGTIPNPVAQKVVEAKPVCNFLGLLSDDPVHQNRLEQLSPVLRTALNDKMRHFFEQSLEWLNKQFYSSDLRPECFICYNTGDKDVIEWLKVLAKDLKAIGVEPFYSKEDLPGGDSLKKFEAYAEEKDFAIVLCTPDLYRKFLQQPDCGVSREIRHMWKRFESKAGTTIPVLLKKEEDADPNDVNPFKDRPEKPFAVLAPMTNYAAILELFVVLRSFGKIKKPRKLAGEAIGTIKAQGSHALDELLEQQQAALRIAFVECLPLVKSKFTSPRPLSRLVKAIPTCLVYDRVENEQGIVDYNHFGIDRHPIADRVYADLSELQKIDATEEADYIFNVRLESENWNNESGITILVNRVGAYSTTKCFNIEIGSYEAYYCDLLKIFAYLRNVDYDPICHEFLRKKEAKIKSLSLAFAKTEQTARFVETNKEKVLQGIKFDLMSAREDQPASINPRLIQFHAYLADFALRKNNLTAARSAFEGAVKWSRLKYGAENHRTLEYIERLARVYYELGVTDQAIANYSLLNANNDDVDALRRLGCLHSLREEFNEAEGCFLNALALPESDSEVRVEYANFLRRLGRYADAKICLDEVIAAGEDGGCLKYTSIDLPNLPDELDEVGNVTISARWFAFYLRILMEQGDLALALCEEFKELILFKPCAIGYILLALSYKRLGRREDAESAFKKVLEFDSNNQIARKNL